MTARRARRHPGAAAAARRRHGVPELRAVPAPDGGAERRLPARDAPAGRRPRPRRRVAEALALVELSGYEARLPRQLSGGQQQRVALARAVVFEPRPAAARRALRRARPQAARGDAARGAAAAAAPAHHHALHHPRPGGGADPLRPHRGDERRPDRAGRHAGGGLRAAGDALRRRFRRGVQPARRRVAERRRGGGPRPRARRARRPGRAARRAGHAAAAPRGAAARRCGGGPRQRRRRDGGRDGVPRPVGEAAPAPRGRRAGAARAAAAPPLRSAACRGGPNGAPRLRAGGRACRRAR